MSELKRFEELVEGDMVLGSHGQPVTVTKAYDVHVPESMWEIELENGTVLKASGNHLWYCETQLDWELLALRKRTAKKLLSRVSSKKLALLEDTATKTQPVETRLVDMVTLLQAAQEPKLLEVIVRVAEAIGHVSENTVTLEDLNGEGAVSETIRTYDARVFAQQLLKLTGLRRYRHYELIVGSVMSTEDMVSMQETVHIPLVRML